MTLEPEVSSPLLDFFVLNLTAGISAVQLQGVKHHENIKHHAAQFHQHMMTLTQYLASDLYSVKEI